MNLRLPPSRSAFTLIELLAVIAVIGILVAIIIPTVSACRTQSAKTVEITAARQLMTAYHLYAAENRGRLLPLQEIAATGTLNEKGNTISGISGMRWPHRLRPFLGDRFRDTLYINTQSEYYSETVSNDDYSLSLGTSFGLNGVFVGGDASSLVKDTPVRSVAQAAAPSDLITFASAHYRALNAKAGYWRIAAPSSGWPAAELNDLSDNTSLDSAYGWIAYRHKGRAVVAYLDGRVALRSSAELRDMRLWSDVARRTNHPDYVPTQ